MRTARIAAILLATSLAGGVLGTTTAADAAPPAPGAIRVQTQAYEGQFNTFRGTMDLRCRAGLAASSVTVSYTQDGFTSPEQPASSLPSCDGTWKRTAYSSYEGFDAGPATVRVRMVLVDAATGAPRGVVTRSQDVYVRPGARIHLPRTAELRPGGVITFRAWARCDTPWVLSSYSVSASQFEGFAFASQQLDIPCDGAYHARRVSLQSSGRSFARGWVRLGGDLSTLDGEFFDPAVGATASRPARVS